MIDIDDLKRMVFLLEHAEQHGEIPEVAAFNLSAYRLALRAAELESERDVMAAENAIMLKLLTDISENHVEYFSEGEGYTFAGVPLDYVSEINMYVSRDVNAENPFPATDAYANQLRADAIDEFGKYHNFSEKLFIQQEAKKYAANLRKENGHD